MWSNPGIYIYIWFVLIPRLHLALAINSQGSRLVWTRKWSSNIWLYCCVSLAYNFTTTTLCSLLIYWALKNSIDLMFNDIMRPTEKKCNWINKLFSEENKVRTLLERWQGPPQHESVLSFKVWISNKYLLKWNPGQNATLLLFIYLFLWMYPSQTFV